MPTVHIASDHAGYELKEWLGKKLSENYKIIDHGAYSKESCDYPLIANTACAAIVADNAKGILICGTGIGMSMVANRNPHIRAALCANEISARLARRHNDANILCLGARLTGEELAYAITEAFLGSEFEGGRHQRRIAQFCS